MLSAVPLGTLPFFSTIPSAEALGYFRSARSSDDSPALERWVKSSPTTASPVRDGRMVLVEDRFIKGQAMPLEEGNYLLAKCFGSMVLFLIADIRARLLDSRHTDAEGAIAFLPREVPKRR